MNPRRNARRRRRSILLGWAVIFSLVFVVTVSGMAVLTKKRIVAQFDRDLQPAPVMPAVAPLPEPTIPEQPKLDTRAYDLKMLQIARGTTTVDTLSDASTSAFTLILSVASGSLAEIVPTSTPADRAGYLSKELWPVRTSYPLVGAVLPFKRVVSYYGNYYSRQMGALGEYDPDVMLAKLQEEARNWEAADPSTPVVPALHYIAVTAQENPGRAGKYRLRMPDDQIDKTLELAKKIDALTFIDVQVALSTIQEEMPLLDAYFKMPTVHFGVDPEFYMHNGAKPGTEIGSMDATQINYVIDYLARIVRENNLPPKMLVIHRFTNGMVTNYQNIKTVPEVQVIIDMDGWGSKSRKLNTYREWIHKQPVQFAGFKLFYKNDFKEKGSSLMTPEEVLQLKPQPMYIQYQ